MRATATARAGLVGNPSDAYGGAVLAVPVPSMAATVTLGTGGEPDALIAAAAAVFGCDEPVTATVTTTIPRSVGLAGSSAIVVATLRALGPDVDPLTVAALALAAERDVLGIPAGWQDRVVQAFGAPVLVDATGGGALPSVRVLRPTPLPVIVAWDEAAAEPSSVLHGALARRSDLGPTMQRLGDLAGAAADAYEAGDLAALGAAVDATAELRMSIDAVTEPTRRMVDVARDAGGHVTSAGSGGSIAGVAADPAAVIADLGRAGYRALAV